MLNNAVVYFLVFSCRPGELPRAAWKGVGNMRVYRPHPTAGPLRCPILCEYARMLRNVLATGLCSLLPEAAVALVYTPTCLKPFAFLWKGPEGIKRHYDYKAFSGEFPVQVNHAAPRPVFNLLQPRRR